MKMPEHVPFFEAKHIAIDKRGPYCKTPSEWFRAVFGEDCPPLICNRLESIRRSQAHLRNGWFYVNLAQNRPSEQEAAARALNKLMRSLGYTEKVPGRWSP